MYHSLEKKTKGFKIQNLRQRF